MFQIQRWLTTANRATQHHRIERLWRDVWTSVTHLYCEALHSLEEDGLLHLADAVHLFCAHYVFLPCLADALHTFTEGWDNHHLRTEGGLSPNQLWVLGHMKNPCDPNKDLQSMELFGTDWEMSDAVHEEPYEVQVQETECPLESVHCGNCTVHDKSIGIIRIIWQRHLHNNGSVYLT
uniref:uncharacterized protein LOC124061413 isoform X2 n=1 Tax=Scatophagus argus TaxID=75038 RepID=UPI001ED804B6|nr:uncharacterized protein LOC124061413 isoform X2 [Scatophagus argus]